MNGAIRGGGIRRLGFVAVLLLSAASLKADPIATTDNPVSQLGTFFAIVLAILAEATCIFLLLRRWRTPQFFIFWLMGMHLLTYPVFLAILWLAEGLHPAWVVAMGEGLIVLLEGILIYAMCRFAPSAKTGLPWPPVFKSLFASFAGNICSAVAFPLVMMVVGWIDFLIETAFPG